MTKMEFERVYSIQLDHNLKRFPRWLRAKKAVKYIKRFLSKHMKVPVENVKLDASVNEKVWERGSEEPPSWIRIRAVKFDDGTVEAELVK